MKNKVMLMVVAGLMSMCLATCPKLRTITAKNTGITDFSSVRHIRVNK